MKTFGFALYCLTVVLLVGCVHRPVASSNGVATAVEPVFPPIYNQTVGPWVNLYPDDPKLAGVSVDQFGVDPFEAKSYEGKHPATVWFYFWDGRVRALVYRPDGTVMSDQWLAARVKPGATEWNDVDFQYGSDPKFLHHADPRPKHETPPP